MESEMSQHSIRCITCFGIQSLAYQLSSHTYELSYLRVVFMTCPPQLYTWWPNLLQCVAPESWGVEAAYRDNRAQAVLEEVLEGSKSIIRALASDALPKTPAHIHVHTQGHHYQQWVPKVVVTQQNEGSLQTTAKPDNKFKTTSTRSTCHFINCQLWQENACDYCKG